jgi:acyl-CoA thioesterase
MDIEGHGFIRTRRLATGQVFDRTGVHVAAITQEGLLRPRKKGEQAEGSAADRPIF